MTTQPQKMYDNETLVAILNENRICDAKLYINKHFHPKHDKGIYLFDFDTQKYKAVSKRSAFTKLSNDLNNYAYLERNNLKKTIKSKFSIHKYLMSAEFLSLNNLIET